MKFTIKIKQSLFFKFQNLTDFMFLNFDSSEQKRFIFYFTDFNIFRYLERAQK